MGKYVRRTLQFHMQDALPQDVQSSPVTASWLDASERVRAQDPSVPSQRVFATSWKAVPGGLHLPAGVDVTVTGGPDASPVNAIDRTDYYRAVTPPGEDYAEGTKGGKGPAPQIAQ